MKATMIQASPTKFVVVTSSPDAHTTVSNPLTADAAAKELAHRKSAHTPPGAWHEVMDLLTAAECMLVDPSTLAN